MILLSIYVLKNITWNQYLFKNNYLIPTKKYLLGSHYVSLLCSGQKATETFSAD